MVSLPGGRSVGLPPTKGMWMKGPAPAGACSGSSGLTVSGLTCMHQEQIRSTVLDRVSGPPVYCDFLLFNPTLQCRASKCEGDRTHDSFHLIEIPLNPTPLNRAYQPGGILNKHSKHPSKKAVKLIGRWFGKVGNMCIGSVFGPLIHA